MRTITKMLVFGVLCAWCLAQEVGAAEQAKTAMSLEESKTVLEKLKTLVWLLLSLSQSLLVQAVRQQNLQPLSKYLSGLVLVRHNQFHLFHRSNQPHHRHNRSYHLVLPINRFLHLYTWLLPNHQSRHHKG